LIGIAEAVSFSSGEMSTFGLRGVKTPEFVRVSPKMLITRILMSTFGDFTKMLTK
jgi:hypothetical protein